MYTTAKVHEKHVEILLMRLSCAVYVVLFVATIATDKEPISVSVDTGAKTETFDFETS